MFEVVVELGKRGGGGGGGEGGKIESGREGVQQAP